MDLKPVGEFMEVEEVFYDRSTGGSIHGDGIAE